MSQEKTTLRDWCQSNEPAENLLFKDVFYKQIGFILDTLVGLLASSLASSYEEYTEIRDKVVVIAKHSSKSVILPVYQISLRTVTITMRDNFYDWKVSIESENEIENDFMELFDQTTKISSCYCEGFPENLVFGPYEKNKKQFTCEIKNDYDLYMFFYILARQMKEM